MVDSGRPWCWWAQRPPGVPKAAQGAWRQGSGQGTSATEVGAPLGLCCGFPLRSRAGPLGLALPLLEPHPVSPPCVSSRFLPPTPPLCRQAAPPPAPAPPFLQDQLLIQPPEAHTLILTSPGPARPLSRTSPPQATAAHQNHPSLAPTRGSSGPVLSPPGPAPLRPAGIRVHVSWTTPPPTPRNQPLRFHSREAQLGHSPLLTAEGRGVPVEPGAPWEAHASSSSPLPSGITPAVLRKAGGVHHLPPGHTHPVPRPTPAPHLPRPAVPRPPPMPFCGLPCWPGLPEGLSV